MYFSKELHRHDVLRAKNYASLSLTSAGGQYDLWLCDQQQFEVNVIITIVLVNISWTYLKVTLL